MCHRIWLFVRTLLRILQECAEPLLERSSIGSLGQIVEESLACIFGHTEIDEDVSSEVVCKLICSQIEESFVQDSNLANDLVQDRSAAFSRISVPRHAYLVGLSITVIKVLPDW